MRNKTFEVLTFNKLITANIFELMEIMLMCEQSDNQLTLVKCSDDEIGDYMVCFSAI